MVPDDDNEDITANYQIKLASGWEKSKDHLLEFNGNSSRENLIKKQTQLCKLRLSVGAATVSFIKLPPKFNLMKISM
jgi:hypothetical protein